MPDFIQRIGAQWRCTIMDLDGYTDYTARRPDVGCITELHTDDGERVYVEIEQIDGDRYYGLVKDITDARNDETPMVACRVQRVECGQRLWFALNGVMSVVWPAAQPVD